MLRAWAATLSKRRIRNGFILFGFVATLIFGPLSLVGAALAFSAAANIFRDPFGSLGIALFGIAGLSGITAAWIRILLPGSNFRESPALRWFTAAGLGGGVIVAGFMCLSLVRDPLSFLPWISVLVLAAGVFLLEATIGEARNAP